MSRRLARISVASCLLFCAWIPQTATAQNPTGACCLDNENCLVLTSHDCGQISNSHWVSAGTDCTDSNGDTLPDACFPPPVTLGECFLDTILAPNVGDVEFGYGISSGGDLLAIGNSLDDEAGMNAGAVYLYQRQGIQWVQQAKLFAVDSQERMQFGTDVALDGDQLAVAASYLGGGAYVFHRETTGWVQEVKLGGATARVAIRGDIVATNGHIFQKHPMFGWIFDTGISTGGSSNIVITDARIISGKYIYRNAGTDVNGKILWQLETTLAPSVPSLGFGECAAATNDLIVVGAPHDDVVGPDAGSAYVFRHIGSSWVQEAKLYPSDWAAYQHFGSSLATDGQLIIVGQPQYNGSGPGSIYLFRQAGGVWAQQRKILPPNPATNVAFGANLALDLSTLLVNDFHSNEAGPDAGAVYVYAVGGNDCNGNGSADWCDIADGHSRDVDANGFPDECVAPIPAASSIGLIVFCIVSLVAGCLVHRRRLN